jgi:hypothetical protein
MDRIKMNEERKVQILDKINDLKHVLFAKDVDMKEKRAGWEQIAEFATRIGYTADYSKIKRFWTSQLKIVNILIRNI